MVSRSLAVSTRFVAFLVAVCLSGRMAAAQVADSVSQAKSLSAAFRHAAQSVMPSVVTVRAFRRSSMRDMLRDPRRRGRVPFPFPDEEVGGSREQTFRDIGSGVIIDSRGLVLTNNHVVARAQEVIIRFPDGSEIEVDDVTTDSMSDLAILRFKPEFPLNVAALGDSSLVEIGDWVIAIGSPFDLEATVSAGIISAKGRRMDEVPRAQLIQTDAAINPGNSGGPLVNLDGEVIGISTAIASSTGGYQGVGFAVPVNKVKWVVEELQEHGQVRRAWLGIKMGELDADAARSLNLRARSGVWVETVIQNSPAEDANVKLGDVIVNFAGVPIRAAGDLQGTVERQRVGTEQKMVVIRNGEKIALNVTMAALPPSVELDNRPARSNE
jgi:serine protease Do